MSVAELESKAEALRSQQAELRSTVAAVKRKLVADAPRRCTPWMRAVAVHVVSARELQE